MSLRRAVGVSFKKYVEDVDHGGMKEVCNGSVTAFIGSSHLIHPFYDYFSQDIVTLLKTR